MVPTVRELVRRANGYLHEAGRATGLAADMRVKCASGVVDVKVERLNTPRGATTFSSIVNNLNDRGYTDGRVKHWVYYDGSACQGGVGHIADSDIATANNPNNGNSIAFFSVNLGCGNPNDAFHVEVMIHEPTHNMGGVQKTAPHSTDFPGGSHPNGFHCTDGLDIMCYADGAPRGNQYTESICGALVYDCGKDDYFHATPAAGSYLATRWNVGSQVNRYLSWGTRPTMTSLSCQATVIAQEETASCAFSGTDPESDGLRYTIDWGDGTIACVPGCTTYASSGTAQSAAHVYTTGGSRTIAVYTTDSASPPASSVALTAPIRVLARPVLTSLSCTSPVPSGPPGTACTFLATDSDSLVRYMIDWGDGTTGCHPSCSLYDSAGISGTAGHQYATLGTRTIRVYAVDDGSPPLTSNALEHVVDVIVDQQPPTVTLSAPVAGRLYRGCGTELPAPGAPRPVYVLTGCAIVHATDDSGIGAIEVFWRGNLVGTDSSPGDGEFTVEFAVDARVNGALLVRAYDTFGNVRQASVGVDAL